MAGGWPVHAFFYGFRRWLFAIASALQSGVARLRFRWCLVFPDGLPTVPEFFRATPVAHWLTSSLACPCLLLLCASSALHACSEMTFRWVFLQCSGHFRDISVAGGWPVHAFFYGFRRWLREFFPVTSPVTHWLISSLPCLLLLWASSALQACSEMTFLAMFWPLQTSLWPAAGLSVPSFMGFEGGCSPSLLPCNVAWPGSDLDGVSCFGMGLPTVPGFCPANDGVARPRFRYSLQPFADACRFHALSVRCISVASALCIACLFGDNVRWTFRWIFSQFSWNVLITSDISVAGGWPVHAFFYGFRRWLFAITSALQSGVARLRFRWCLVFSDGVGQAAVLRCKVHDKAPI